MREAFREDKNTDANANAMPKMIVTIAITGLNIWEEKMLVKLIVPM
jgi:hypothetical protein